MAEQKPYITPETLSFIEDQFDHLASLFPDLYAESNRETLAYATIAKLSEEIGELSEAVLKSFQRQRKTKDDKDAVVSKEIGDVLVVTLLLAHLYKIDPNQALSEKIEHLTSRRIEE